MHSLETLHLVETYGDEIYRDREFNITFINGF